MAAKKHVRAFHGHPMTYAHLDIVTLETMSHTRVVVRHSFVMSTTTRHRLCTILTTNGAPTATRMSFKTSSQSESTRGSGLVSVALMVAPTLSHVDTLVESP